MADLSPAERGLESDLARLRPATKAAGPEEMLRLAFRAGRAASDAEDARQASRKLVLWRAAAAVLVGGLGISLISRPVPQVIERERTKVVYVDRIVSPPATVTPAVARESEPHNNPGVTQSQQPANVDQVTPSPLPGFLASADSPSRPLIPPADADYLSVRDAVLRLGVRVIPSPRAEAPAGGPVTLETLLGPNPSAPAREPSRRGGVGAGLDQLKKFLTGGQT